MMEWMSADIASSIGIEITGINILSVLQKAGFNSPRHLDLSAPRRFYIFVMIKLISYFQSRSERQEIMSGFVQKSQQYSESKRSAAKNNFKINAATELHTTIIERKTSRTPVLFFVFQG